ncbi:MAG: hypothetical protein ABMB14_12580 [Myxococcota bacterium]
MRWTALVVVTVGCAAPPQGLRATPSGDGPVVRVDWDAEPLPDIPFPNDLATRPDPLSPTGLRLNLPTDAPVAVEAKTRATLNTLSGFGVFAPITVAFDGRLDLDALLDRHPDDLDRPDAYADDAVLVIDIDPASPDYLRPVPLDLGAGRFPQQAGHLDGYLANDPRAGQPSLLWESGEEDLDADGVLDDGEDTDGDGWLDHPNVWPPGSDPARDLLSFYDLQTNTLVLRPVVPLREATRYAVVLTSSLVDEAGAPVRSPWAWVNHTRQTEALLPVVDALAQLGRPVDDIAFAWSFTTGDVTTELWQVVEGLSGRGPLWALAADYPPGVTEGHNLHSDIDPDPMFLPVDRVLDPLAAIGYFPPESIAVLTDTYRAFGAGVVGGVVVGPDLLTDRDDGGTDDSDEHWEIDARRGTVVAAPRRIPFTCVVPKGQGPFPIVIHAHGYGSTRVEFLGFAHALVRHGIAACGIDAPGQGLPLDDATQELVAGLMQLAGTEPLWWHLLDDRQRDLDNDGVPDPAADMFTADAFHTRDTIRQSVVDTAALIAGLRACGVGTMERVIPSADGPIHTGEAHPSCDWNGDGAPDLGGPDTRFLLDGISQGGIITGVSIAVNDAATAVLTVPGGGLGDVGLRTDIDEVTNAMVGRALSPLIVGRPGPDGVAIDQVVISIDTEISLSITTRPALPVGGRVVVRNLDLGTESVGWIGADGRFRVPIAANALDPGEKRLLTGIPANGYDPSVVYAAPDPTMLGDRLEIEIRDATGAVTDTIDTIDAEVVHEGVTIPAGSPVIAGSWGLGLIRGSSALLRTVDALAIGIEGGDPIAYAHRWRDEPFDQPKDVLIHLTVGDTTVPEATGIALARAAGIVSVTEVDPRLGTTPDRWLVDHEVVRGMEEYGPYVGPDGAPILFDPDDLDDGTDGLGAPSEVPLRLTRPVEDGGVQALRFLYVDPHGTHAYFLPDEQKPFDLELFAVQQNAEYLATGGTHLTDDPCLATRDCPFLAPYPPVGDE